MENNLTKPENEMKEFIIEDSMKRSLISIKNEILENINSSLTNMINNREDSSFILDKLMASLFEPDSNVYKYAMNYNIGVVEKTSEIYKRKILGESCLNELLELREVVEIASEDLVKNTSDTTVTENLPAVAAYYAFEAVRQATIHNPSGIMSFAASTTNPEDINKPDPLFYPELLDKFIKLLGE